MLPAHVKSPYHSNFRQEKPAVINYPHKEYLYNEGNRFNLHFCSLAPCVSVSELPGWQCIAYGHRRTPCGIFWTGTRSYLRGIPLLWQFLSDLRNKVQNYFKKNNSVRALRTGHPVRDALMRNNSRTYPVPFAVARVAWARSWFWIWECITFLAWKSARRSIFRYNYRGQGQIKVNQGHQGSLNDRVICSPSSVHRIFPKFGSESSKHLVDKIDATPLWDFIISDPIPSR